MPSARATQPSFPTPTAPTLPSSAMRRTTPRRRSTPGSIRLAPASSAGAGRTERPAPAPTRSALLLLAGELGLEQEDAFARAKLDARIAELAARECGRGEPRGSDLEGTHA